MDKYHELNGIRFVWNEMKARQNLTKHEIAFEQAVEVFFDPFFRLVDTSPGTEPRDAVIGMDAHWNLLFVVHILIEDEAIRIISARKATRNGRQHYED